MRTEVKKSKKRNDKTYKVIFDGLTQGELLAMKHALEGYAERSPIGADVSMYLKNALYEAVKTEPLLNDI